MDDPWRAAATAGTRAQGRLQGPTCQAQGQEQKEEEVSSITRYDADQIAAGDTNRHQGGQDQAFLPRLRSINKRRDVHIVYNNGRAGFVHLHLDADDPIRIRE
jgi:hypothetical protein